MERLTSSDLYRMIAALVLKSWSCHIVWAAGVSRVIEQTTRSDRIKIN